MKPAKAILFLGVAGACVCALAGLMVLKRHGAQTASAPQAQSAAATPAPQPVAAPALPALPKPPTPEAKAALPDADASSPAKADASSLAKAAPPTPPQPAPAPAAAAGGSAVQDPLAREALSLVGADSKAEAYWIEAINDSRLSADERQNLIEDLNEDGLTDPKHPAAEDLPLIMNRLALIEELAPDAMDKVNFDAFAEAYKDLVNLAALAMGGGEPVN